METGSRPNARAPDIVRDEAKVLGLVSAVRVWGAEILPAIPSPTDRFAAEKLSTFFRLANHSEKPSGRGDGVRGRWIAARWRGRYHEPLPPLREVTWCPAGWRFVDGNPGARGVDAVLWVIDDEGERLPADRVVFAAAALDLIEANTVVRSESLQLVKKVRNRLNEGAAGGFRSPSSRHALRAARSFVAAEAKRHELSDEAWLASFESVCRRLRKQKAEFHHASASGHPSLAEANLVAAWSLMEERDIVRRTSVLERTVPGADPRDILRGLDTAFAGGSGAYLALREQLASLCGEYRKNESPAFLLDCLLVLDDWSSSTAARLWTRSQFGRDSSRERAEAQAVDTARRSLGRGES
jgi:hypothetical protein